MVLYRKNHAFSAIAKCYLVSRYRISSVAVFIRTLTAIYRTLAVELGPHGVRTVCLHSTGSPETGDSIAKTFSQDPAVLKKFTDGWTERSAQHQLLSKPTSLENVAAMAAFMASDKAGASTGSLANMSAGMNV